jgi:uncharacterized protein
MKVWIDLDNSPHVHFFAPIIRRLTEEGLEPILTVRSFSQTEELARQYGLNFATVGKHRTPGSTPTRIGATVNRSIQLMNRMRGVKPAAAISHGSRAQTLAAWGLGIPSMALYDYEFASSRVFHMLSTKVLIPSVIPDDRLGAIREGHGKVVRYPGFKEEVYVYDLQPDPAVLSALNLDREKVIVIARPPASWAHYNCHQSEVLFHALISRLREEAGAQVVILPRTREQAAALRASSSDVQRAPFIMPDSAIDALSLMHYADAVFSGGGTMGREAALLGVDAYSVFAGKLGAADQALATAGRLRLLQTPQDVQRITVEKRPALAMPLHARSATKEFIIGQILKLVGSGPLRQYKSSYSDASSRA